MLRGLSYPSKRYFVTVPVPNYGLSLRFSGCFSLPTKTSLEQSETFQKVNKKSLNNFVIFHVILRVTNLFILLLREVNEVSSQYFHGVSLIYFSFLFAVLINDGGKRHVFE